ncbi:hypothetical protein V865_001230 [Kwoniella europaea PYCC6329]|uniref:Barwin domain-containing protein n=1 Tax=Kwoniella europaea PYCC6329 TaxID=1423913 RepID=A0AAX4KBG8_9TREE
MILPTVAATLALFTLVRAGVSSSGVMGTIYYDGSGSCGKEGDIDWGAGDYSPIIESSVAFDASLMSGNPAEYCGKEIQVTKADGTPFEFSEGKLFIGEACPACAGGVRLDLSAKALVEIVGDCKTNAMGISYQVLDTMAGPEYSSIPGGSLGGGTGGNTSTSATSAVPDAAVSSASSSIPANSATQTVANPATATVPAGISSSSSVAAGVTPTGVPGSALFAEGDVASNASCKRRKRRLGDFH